MRLPTLEVVVSAARRSAARFPLVLLSGIVSAAIGIQLVDDSGGGSEPWSRILIATTLGIPLFFGLTLLAERRATTAAGKWTLLAAGALFLGLFWYDWPTWSDEMQATRYVQMSVATHLLVAFAPYARIRQPNGFWQYNRLLFIRFLTAALYSGVLYVGLALALLALDKLLGVDVPPQGYGRLGMVMAFVFNTWFFVSGIPEDLDAVDGWTDYPTGLRIFTQYILVPLVALDLVILTLYFGKVVITRQWPSGWIGWLVSGVAGVGILSWLLVHPLEERKEHAWVKPFTRGFYIALLPAVVMLWLAIYKRVEQYGITERRYFLLVLSIWLGGIALYYALSRSRSIKLIPESLFLLAVVTSTGPWSAFAVSRASQVSRLERRLTAAGMLHDGKLQRPAGDLPDSTLKEMSGGFRYLLDMHGVASVDRWLSDSLRLTLGDTTRNRHGHGEEQARSVLASLGLRYRASYEGPSAAQQFSFYATGRPTGLNISGYTWSVRLQGWFERDSIKVTDGIYVRTVPDSFALQVVRSGKRVLRIDLNPMLDSAAAYQLANPNKGISPDVLHVEAKEGEYRAFVRFTSVMGSRSNGKGRLSQLDADLLLRVP